MYLLKIRFHIVAFIKVLIYKLLFGKKFIIGKKSTFRRNFHVMIEGDGKKNDSCIDDTVIPAGDGVGGDNPDADDQPADWRMSISRDTGSPWEGTFFFPSQSYKEPLYMIAMEFNFFKWLHHGRVFN